MRNKTKILSFLIIFAYLLTNLYGCHIKSNENNNSNNTLTILNYGKYFDMEAIEQFEEETGITVKYEEYESPEEMYTKYKSGSIDYDIICTSEYMVEKLIQEGEVEEVDFSLLENYDNLNPDILDMTSSYDPDHKYSLPYFYGTVGLLYNVEKVDETDLTSWDCLWDDKYKNEIIMMNSVRDSFIPALICKGYSINETNENHLRDALDTLYNQYPNVYAYYVDEIGDEMIAENASIAILYSGEAAYAMDFNENLAYSVPKEGSNLWIDSWFIPKTCKNKEAAMQFMDFTCREDIATLNFEYVYYASPITAVIEAQDPEIKSNEAINPSKETLERCELFTALDDETQALYSRLWQELKTR